MIWSHEISVPPGYETVVNGHIDERRPPRVGTYDQVYFVSFAPIHPKFETQATSREGIVHKVVVTLKLELQRGNLGEVLRDAGYSTYTNIIRVSAEELMTRQNLLDSLKAGVDTYTRSMGFFELANHDRSRQDLNQKLAAECAKARLQGEVASCEVIPIVPGPILLGQLAAMAGKKESLKEEGRTRTYTDNNLGKIYEYFLETLRQSELIAVETERAKADVECAKVEAQEQIAIARTDVKIVEREQESRKTARDVELQIEDAKRRQALQELNSTIMETAAAYEFAYKSRRIEEEMALATKELEIAKVKEAKKKLDMELELDRERQFSLIRAEEKSKALTQVGELIVKLGAIPTPDYKGVHTLITSSGTGLTDSRDFAGGLLLGLLTKMSEGIPGQKDLPPQPKV